MLWEWALNHKTMICLNGGMNCDLNDTMELMKDNNNYPWSYFKESEEALNNILTNIAIVLPKKIFLAAEYIRKKLIIFEKKENYFLIMKSDLYLKKSFNNGFTNNEVIQLIEQDYTYNNFEIELINILNQCSLAR